MASLFESLKQLGKDVFTELKKPIDEHVTGEVECACCRKTGRKISFNKTSDGAMICKDCYEELPYTYKDEFAEHDFETIQTVLNYMDFSKRTLEPIFRCDYNYEFFEMDRVHGLVRIGRTIMDVRNLDMHILSFNPEETGGFMGIRAKGNVKAIFSMENPRIHIMENIAFGVTAPMRPTFQLGVDYVCKNPKKMTECEEELERLIKRFRNAG